ncbi:MAG: hypothetical protein K9J24_14070, partial [Bacteroidales bacterium]|nr:hypothetical protein [Bacteroidales bacterium]
MQLRTRTGIIINLIVLILISIFFVRECCETKDLPVIRKLDQHWMFHMAGENRQYPAKTPGLVHLDLFENALIPEPFFASNEDSLQWIGEKSWIYETYFNASREMLQKKNIHFVFEGLDTFADV